MDHWDLLNASLHFSIPQVRHVRKRTAAFMPSSDTHSLHFDVLPCSQWLSLKPARETSRSHLQHTLLCLRRFCKRSSIGEQSKHFGSCQGIRTSSALQPFQFLYHDKNKSLGSILLLFTYAVVLNLFQHQLFYGEPRCPSQLLLLPLGYSKPAPVFRLLALGASLGQAPLCRFIHQRKQFPRFQPCIFKYYKI